MKEAESDLRAPNVLEEAYVQVLSPNLSLTSHCCFCENGKNSESGGDSQPTMLEGCLKADLPFELPGIGFQQPTGAELSFCELEVVVGLDLFLWVQVPRRKGQAPQPSACCIAGDTAGQLTQALPGREEYGERVLGKAPEHPGACYSFWYFGRMEQSISSEFKGYYQCDREGDVLLISATW